MNAERLLDPVVTGRPGNWAVFAGAGISAASGIPTATALTRKLLGLLGATPTQERLILEAGIPFELIMETLRERLDLGPLLAVFESSTPSMYHTFFARLMAKQQLLTFATTNFDTLLEQALDALGLKAGDDFEVFASEEEFQTIDWSVRKPRILKLHGCVSRKGSLGVVLSRIAARSYVRAVRPSISALFSTGRHREVLILGYYYSCGSF